MKTIYTKINTPIQEGDVKVAQTGSWCELSIAEANESGYADYVVNISAEQFASAESHLKDLMISRLWSACTEYQSNKIADLGVFKLSQKTAPNTKALAIVQWVEDLWTLYYTKRDQITNTRSGNSMDKFDEVNEVLTPLFDFSEMGNIPYSYKEAIEEA